MPTPSTREFETPTHGPRTRRWNDEVVALAVVAVLTFAAGLALNTGPERVDAVSITNPTDYRIGVTVSPATGGPGAALPAVEEQGVRTYRDVLDQGDRWLFRFTSQGFAAGEVVVDRGVLDSRDWVVDVPIEVADRLRAAGVPVPPPLSQR